MNEQQLGRLAQLTVKCMAALMGPERAAKAWRGTGAIRRLLGSGDAFNSRQSKFVDLAPTEEADKAGVYAEALLYATSNPRISNIALTGPYGSGKSSIIRSFLLKHGRDALEISLAAFLPEATSSGGTVSKQEIERSILQQLLYGADANKLPLSRFKRINTPRRTAAAASLFVLLGLFSSWYVAVHIDELMSGIYFSPFLPANWPNIITFSACIAFLWISIHRFYIASFGFSLKSISLKDIEIAPAEHNQDSILNRHLDEIIYFFQSTKYDLVVIEDLDRFKNTDIFVTLREINSIVNANSGVRRKIRFLYALRDDMFVNVDRTKFFEFIIPVIPIVNSSNSVDKVLEQGKRLSLDSRLDRQFIREVSRFLNDLRLIQNIFNEYYIYIANLKVDDEDVLDANKLLAVLIYKNVFPRDFEDLHRGKGVLSSILNRHEEFVTRSEAEIRDQVSEIEDEIDDAQRQVPSDISELRRIYAMAIIEKIPSSVTHVGVEGQPLVEITALANSDALDKIITASRIICHNIHGHHSRVDISSIQDQVDSRRTYIERKDLIERKSAKFTEDAAIRVRELRSSLASIRITKFNAIAQKNADAIDIQLKELGEEYRLAKFLLLEGYIDDTYYQYTSLFHSGRLSPSDNKFLIQIRGFSNPEPGFQIDNPAEVITAMRDEDFNQAYALNIRIVDCLLGDEGRYANHISGLVQFVVGNFRQCEPFLIAYYATGTAVPSLLAQLVAMPKRFVPNALSSSRSLPHVAHIVSQLPPSTLGTLPAKFPELSQYVSANLPAILGSGVDLDPSRLKLLGVEIADLPAMKTFPRIARYISEEGFYSLTIENVEFIFREILGRDDIETLRTQHYTTILGTGNTSLISRIGRSFPDYIENILTRLPGNSDESVSAILAVIAHEDIEFDLVCAFLKMQAARLPSLEGVPVGLRATVFQLEKIDATWANCLSFIQSDGFDAESLTAYLNAADTLKALSRQAVPDGADNYELRSFLFKNSGLSDAAYRVYMGLLPRHFKDAPEGLSAEKLRILVEQRKIAFSAGNFEALEEHEDIQLLYVSLNIDAYLKAPDVIEIDDDFREALISTSISEFDKLSVVRSMDLAMIASSPSRARSVGNVLAKVEFEDSLVDAAAARTIIINSSPVNVQIHLFNRWNRFFSKDDVREIIAALPSPYREITKGYHTPRIENDDENVALARWLEARGLISSFSEGIFGDVIRINLFRR